MGADRQNEDSRRRPIAFVVACTVIVGTFLSLPLIQGDVCQQYANADHAYCSANDILLVLVRPYGEWFRWIEPALVAIATVAIAIFTLQLKISTDRLWNEAKAARKLARDEFFAAHRPKIVVGAVSWEGSDAGDDDEAMLGPILVRVSYANAGRSDAHLITRYATVIFTQTADANDNLGSDFLFRALPPRPPYRVTDFVPDSAVFGPGRRAIFDVSARATDYEQWRRFCTEDGTQTSAYIIGFVRYADKLGNEHCTNFCRRFNPATERFIAVDDPDYEYAD